MILEDLKNKRVLVTGASSGIGAAAAIEFAKQGCFVGVHYFATGTGADDTLKEVKKYADGCIVKADVRKKDQVVKMVEEFASKAGGIDKLINNAGTLVDRRPFETAEEEFFDDVFNVNVKSTFLVTQAALKYLKQGTDPSIVSIGSIAGHNGGGPGAALYATAKGAVATLTISMAKDFAQHGIRVNSVLPGFIETRFHQKFSDAQRRARVAKETPLGRNGRAEDVANAIVFLSSNAAAFITGEYIAVNGGLLMRA
jgi:3-oxoacyl-[acyl-carrier protein] reductase